MTKLSTKLQALRDQIGSEPTVASCRDWIVALVDHCIEFALTQESRRHRIKAARKQTAKHRFYIVTADSSKFPYIICDGEKDPKSFGQFRERADADLFLEVVQNRHAEATND